MNAERLLALYEMVAEAPDAVPRLRRFVLDLAVRGKLVPQAAGDEPALNLLATIVSERKERVEHREIKRGASLEPIEEAPFVAPAGWEWIPLGDTGNIFSGNSINATTREQLEKTDVGLPFIATKDVGYGLDVIDYDNGLLVPVSDGRFKIARAKSVLICAEGGSAGRKIGLADREICFGNKLLANETWSVIVPEFVRFVYMSDFFYGEFVARMTGVIGGISLRNFLQLPIPLPPLAEQRRIVAKVEELMALLDRLEAARTAREATRDRLTAASLARLTAPDADPRGAEPGKVGTGFPSGSATNENSFPANARFALATLPALTTRPDQIKPLRQTILNLAVRGKLVEQDPTDEPASELLKRIAVERAAFLDADYPNPSEAKTQKKKQAQQRLPGSLPELPRGWSWATLQQCSLMVIDCKNKTAPYSSTGIKLVRTTNVRDGALNSNDQKFVSEATYEAWSLRAKPEPGDILVTREAPMGEVCIIPDGERICLGQRMMLARLVPDTIDGRFMLYSLRDPDLMERVQDKPLGMTVQHLRVGGVETLLVPLPPLAEQHRIVAKVDALMALCDRLEAALTTADTTRARLLEALLHEALAPAAEAVTEAAE